MRSFVGFLFFVCLGFNSFGALALPKITVEKINGFEVHFVDIGAGNSVGVSFQVPFGTLHDYGRFLGRAHLLEHLMHVGTLKYPGYHAFDELLEPAGIVSNAGTWSNRTMYYASANDSQTELIIKVFLSMLGGLELNPETVEKERAVVINEIVEEGMPTQSTAFDEMPYVQLLPPEHPWARAKLGDREMLKGLSVQDLGDLYNQVYRPGVVKLAIHGNFSQPGFLEKVRGWIAENVKAAPQQNGKTVKLTKQEKLAPENNLATREIPSLFSEKSMAPESEKRLYIHSEDFHIGQITLEADSTQFPANVHAMSMLSNYLGVELPGSFIHKLKYELGWITEASIYSVNVRGRELLSFSYTMSESGRGRGTEINEIFFRGLKDAQETFVSNDFLERAKRSRSHAIEIASRSVPAFMNFYGTVLTQEKSFAVQMEDLSKLTAQEIRSVAAQFSPDQALYTFAGPEVSEMDFDALYKRKFKLEDNRADLKRYMTIMRQPATIHFTPTIRPVALGQVDSKLESVFVHTKPFADFGERMALDLRSNLPDTSASLDLYFKPEGPADLVALDLVLGAFMERYDSELTYMHSEYLVSLAESRLAQNLVLSAHGNDGYAPRALAWKIDRLAEFVPTAGEIKRSRERYSEEKVAAYVDAFSAQVTMGSSKLLVDPFNVSGLDARKIALSLSENEVLQNWARLRKKATRHLTAAGPLNLADVGRVRIASNNLISTALTPGDSAQLKSRFAWNGEETEAVHRPFEKSKGADAHAIVRYYKGPAVSEIKDAVAFRALGSLIAQRIYIHNRGEQELGYIHNGSTSVPDKQHVYFAMYGGTSGAENAAKILTGWQHIFQELADGTTTDKEIQNAISSEANGLARKKTTAKELMSAYLTGLDLHRDARASRAELAAVKTLTPADVRESARKYLLGADTPYTQLTMSGCEADLR